RTLAAVAAAAQRLRREQAQAAVRVTEGPVNEYLGFNSRGGRDVADFFKRQFAGQHHALEPQPVQGVRPGAIMDAQLRAGVQFQVWKMFSHQVIDAQVLNDKGIDADLGQRCDRVDQFGEFVLANQGVDGDENPTSRLQTVGVGRNLV